MDTQDMINHLRRGQPMSAKVSGKMARRLERAVTMETAMRNAAVEALARSSSGEEKCGVCGEQGGEHTAECPMCPVIDICLMPVDFELHGRAYLEKDRG